MPSTDEKSREKALITGASSGIGAAVARRMAARGVEVWVAARRQERLDDVVRAIEGAGGIAHAVAVDVADGAETERRVLALDDEVGGFDVVLANAGVGGRAKVVSETTWQEVDALFRTNVIGVLATLLPLVPRMIARARPEGGGRRGHIACVSSIASEMPLPAAPDYGASKAAVSFFLACAQQDLPRRGVDVTLIHPGFVKTDLTAKNKFPMPFLLELDEAARIIDDAMAARARFVRFPLGLVALMAAGKAMPAFLRDAVVARNLPK